MSRAVIERVVNELASYERGSASAGERRAAEWLHTEFRAAGCEARIEEERAHGGYWWPLGLLNAVPGLLALARRRVLSVLAGAGAAAAIWDDVSGRRLWFRRAVLPHRTTWNVVAETGDREAERTVVLIAHHDAAHSGLVFHPAIPRIGMRLAPGLHERATKSAPIMYSVIAGPVLAALSGLLGGRHLRRAAVQLCAGTTLAMADIGNRQVVPGANDNLTAVAALVAVARALQERPVSGVRVILLSTGSEESFMEGMQGFGRRHFRDLPRETTDFVCLECVGSPQLCVVEGEGMLVVDDYPEEARDALARAGETAGVPLRRGLRLVVASDALIALRAGYRSSLLGGVDDTKFPSNYHWPSDVPENLTWESIERAAAVSEAYVRNAAR
jgi:hypothetical protein